MRVISGSARSLKLKTLDGIDVRPTTDRIKETLFNMIQNDIYGCSFLDVFSGSGAIGIEALSRGAKECVFVDNNPKAVEVINDNLEFTKLKENALVLKNLEWILQHGEAKRIKVRVPHIPEFNTDEDVAKSVEILKGMGVVDIEEFTYVIR